MLKAVEAKVWTLRYVPNQHRTQEMCNKAIELDPCLCFMSQVIVRLKTCVKEPLKMTHKWWSIPSDDDHRIPHPTTHTVGLEASAFAGVHGRGFPCSFNDVIQHSHWLVGILSYKSRGLPYVICHAYGNEVSSL